MTSTTLVRVGFLNYLREITKKRLIMDSSQFTEKEAKNTKEIVNLRLHMKQAINLKIFKILKSVLPVFMLHPADNLISSCAALSNLKNRLIK